MLLLFIQDHLAKVLINVKEKLKEAQTRVAESVRIAEDSLVEKDAALLREKHALSKIMSVAAVGECDRKQSQ